MGTPAITTRGLKEGDMAVVVQLIDEVLVNIENESVIAAIGEKVVKMMKDYPIFA